MENTKQQLKEAELKAFDFINKVEELKIIVPGKTERQINNELYELAKSDFDVKKFWHKRIVRTGENTLLPYEHNPKDLIVKKDDIIFFDYGPVFNEMESDIGRTYVLGTDENKLKLKNDIENAWKEGKEYYMQNKDSLTGADFYNYTKLLATKYGWDYGNNHCGHLIEKFPHEKTIGEETINYLHPENNKLMSDKDKFGNERFWIYEIHFIDKERQIGGFFEQSLL